MSDIPLRSIRRNNAKGYTRISGNVEDVSEIGSSNSSSGMPPAVAAAASSSARRSLLKGKRKERYSDDPLAEEQARLLGDDQFSRDRLEDEMGQDGRRTRRVQSYTSFAYSRSQRSYGPVAFSVPEKSPDSQRQFPNHPLPTTRYVCFKRGSAWELH